MAGTSGKNNVKPSSILWIDGGVVEYLVPQRTKQMGEEGT